MKKSLKTISKGFTLIELLIVMAVLGVLASIVVIAVNPAKRINQANDARIKTDIAQVTRAIQAYYSLNGNYPPSLDTIVASGEIKQIPSPPVSGSYAYVLSDNEVALSFPLQDKPGYVWCWASIPNQIIEVQGTACTPEGTSPPPPLVSPTVLAPVNEAGYTYSSSGGWPPFSWSSVPGAASYEWQVVLNGNTVGSGTTPATSAALTGTSWMPQGEHGAYFRVRAKNAQEVGPWSGYIYFVLIYYA